MRRPPIAVVDFFSGCGGTALGFEQAGMSIVGAIDNDSDAVGTYRRNFPGATVLERDIRTVQVEEVAALMPTVGATLFSGCAPCQPFSKQNQVRKSTDPRRFLLAEFERFIVKLLPEFVVVENVPGLQKLGNSAPFVDFVQALRRAGYEVESAVLSALQYGVPQVRRRLVLIASRVGQVRMPMPTHGPGGAPPSTVRDWIFDLPPLPAGGLDRNDVDHAAMKLSPLNVRRIRATPQGGGRGDWKSALLLNCHQNHDGHSDVYGRLAWDRPAAAITTRCLSYSNGRFGHPEQHRAISLREAACLQTFPRSFRFLGTLTSRGRQVGNAVPPLLARRLAESICEAARMSMRSGVGRGARKREHHP